VHTGATELDHFAAKWVRTAQNQIPARCNSRDLPPPIGPSAIDTCRQFRSWRVLRRLGDRRTHRMDQYRARSRTTRPILRQFETEKLKPQLLGATHFVCALRQSRHVPWTRRCWRHEGPVCFEQCVQLYSPGVSRRARSIRFDDLRRSRDRFRRGNIRKTVRDRASAGRSRISPNHHDTGRAPLSLGKKMLPSRRASSRATCWSVIMFPEPVGHSTLNDSP